MGLVTVRMVPKAGRTSVGLDDRGVVVRVRAALGATGRPRRLGGRSPRASACPDRGSNCTEGRARGPRCSRSPGSGRCGRRFASAQRKRTHCRS